MTTLGAPKIALESSSHFYLNTHTRVEEKKTILLVFPPKITFQKGRRHLNRKSPNIEFLNVAKSLFIVSLHFLKDVKSHIETKMKFAQGEDKL